MGLLTDQYLRVQGVNDGSIFALGDCATIQQPKLVDRIQLLFEEADVQHRGSLDLQQFQSLVEKKINEFPQVFQSGFLIITIYRASFSYSYFSFCHI